MCQPTHGKAARGQTSVCCLVSLAGSLRFFFQSSELAPSLLALCQCGPTTGRAAATNFNVEALSLSMRLSVIAAAVGGVVWGGSGGARSARCAAVWSGGRGREGLFRSRSVGWVASLELQRGGKSGDVLVAGTYPSSSKLWGEWISWTRRKRGEKERSAREGGECVGRIDQSRL